MSKTRVMIDIETIGTEPGCVIASIGAVKFDTDGPVPDHGERSREGAFFASVDIESCQDHGLTIDAGTLAWWFDQPGVARKQLEGGDGLSSCLNRLRQFVGDADEVWANSPKFDMSILEAAYEAIGQEPPWEFYELRDYRTLTALPGAENTSTDGVEHHALDDAYHQAVVASRTLWALSPQGDSDA